MSHRSAVGLSRVTAQAWKPLALWEASQNGLVLLAPHLQNATRPPRSSSLPSASITLTSPCTRRGPFARSVMVGVAGAGVESDAFIATTLRPIVIESKRRGPGQSSHSLVEQDDRTDSCSGCSLESGRGTDVGYRELVDTRSVDVVIVAWLAITFALLAIELHGGAFFALFGAIGSGAAAVVAVVAPRFYVGQVVAALVATAVGVLLFRPYVSRAFRRGHNEPAATGVHGGLLGARVTALDAVSPRPGGHVRLHGESWLAQTTDDQLIAAGTEAVIVGVRGTTLTVEPLSHNRKAPE